MQGSLGTCTLSHDKEPNLTKVGSRVKTYIASLSTCLQDLQELVFLTYPSWIAKQKKDIW